MDPNVLASMGMAFSLAGPAIGAGYAIAKCGKAMAGAVTENPGVAGKGMIPIVLGEALAIYGFLIAMLMLGQLPVSTEASGGYALATGVTIGLSCIGSGYGIGQSGAAMIAALAENPETFSKNIVSIVLAESIAIYGLLVSFILMNRV